MNIETIFLFVFLATYILFSAAAALFPRKVWRIVEKSGIEMTHFHYKPSGFMFGVIKFIAIFMFFFGCFLLYVAIRYPQ